LVVVMVHTSGREWHFLPNRQAGAPTLAPEQISWEVAGNPFGDKAEMAWRRPFPVAPDAGRSLLGAEGPRGDVGPRKAPPVRLRGPSSNPLAACLNPARMWLWWSGGTLGPEARDREN